MCMQTPWEKALEFHGHVCPGLVIGFRAAEAGMRELGVEAPGSVEMVTIVENQACGVDAVQVLTGCTFGKGNLVFHDYGKHVFTFVRRDTGQAVRVACRVEALSRNGEIETLRNAWMNDPSRENERALERKREEIADHLMEMPEEELLDLRAVAIETPARPRIEPTLRCSRCGEGAMESRTRLVGGQVVCLSCLERGREAAS